MMKNVNIQDVDSLQDEMLDLMDVSSEIQESLGKSYNLPDDIDEDELLGELDALEADMGFESEGGVPSYLQPDKESDLEGELNFPSAPTGHAPVPGGRANVHVRPVIQSLMHWKQIWGLRVKVECLRIFNLIRNLTSKESSTFHQHQLGMLPFLVVELTYITEDELGLPAVPGASLRN
ncbi:hypothetical protein OROGR_018343 [Orobanche gracilis]